jgi:uncharacterized membrane protein
VHFGSPAASQLHLIIQALESELETMNEDRLRKWVLISLAVLFAAQLYLVQELFAALFLFAATFLVLAVFAGVVYLLHEGGQRAVAWVETQSKGRFANSPRAPAFAPALSKKPSPHPHSNPAP